MGKMEKTKDKRQMINWQILWFDTFDKLSAAPAITHPCPTVQQPSHVSIYDSRLKSKIGNRK